MRNLKHQKLDLAKVIQIINDRAGIWTWAVWVQNLDSAAVRPAPSPTLKIGRAGHRKGLRLVLSIAFPTEHSHLPSQGRSASPPWHDYTIGMPPPVLLCLMLPTPRPSPTARDGNRTWTASSHYLMESPCPACSWPTKYVVSLGKQPLASLCGQTVGISKMLSDSRYPFPLLKFAKSSLPPFKGMLGLCLGRILARF